jgi:hypothetical protein
MAKDGAPGVEKVITAAPIMAAYLLCGGDRDLALDDRVTQTPGRCHAVVSQKVSHKLVRKTQKSAFS